MQAYMFKRILPERNHKEVYVFEVEKGYGFYESPDFESLGRLVDYFLSEEGKNLQKNISVVWDAPQYLKDERERTGAYWEAKGDPISWYYSIIEPEERLKLQKIFSEKGFSINIE